MTRVTRKKRPILRVLRRHLPKEAYYIAKETYDTEKETYLTCAAATSAMPACLCPNHTPQIMLHIKHEVLHIKHEILHIMHTRNDVCRSPHLHLYLHIHVHIHIHAHVQVQVHVCICIYFYIHTKKKHTRTHAHTQESRGALPMRLARHYFLQLMNGVDYIHERSASHRCDDLYLYPYLYLYLYPYLAPSCCTLNPPT